MNRFKIRNKFIGIGSKTHIIAEIGINHGGNFKRCMKMINAATKAGADSIKIQTSDVDERIETPVLAHENTVYFGARDHSIRALVIKRNGNPDEKWDAPYFSDKAKDDENPNPSDWSPSC